MRSSPETDQLAKALAEAQKAFPVIPKSHVAKVPTKSGGEYSYRYADFPDCKGACDPILYANGLVVSQMPEYADGIDQLTTRVAHSESDQWIEGSMRLFLSAETPQAQGSAITYAKRYAYCAALGIVADEDDDGAAATHPQQQARRQDSHSTVRQSPRVQEPPPADPESGELALRDAFPGATTFVSRGAGGYWLFVDIKEKDEAKKLGARWDAESKRWYVPEGKDPSPFARWGEESF